MTTSTLLISMYLLGVVAGVLIGFNIHELCMSHKGFKNKKMCKLIELFKKACTYNIEGIRCYYDRDDTYRCELPRVNTVILIDKYSKDIQIVDKPDTLDEIRLFEYITEIKIQIQSIESTNATMTRLLT